MSMELRTCQECNALFKASPTQKTKKFCTSRCSTIAWKKRNPTPKKMDQKKSRRRSLRANELKHVQQLVNKSNQSGLCRYLGIGLSTFRSALPPDNCAISVEIIKKLMACTLEEAPAQVSRKEITGKVKVTLTRNNALLEKEQTIYPVGVERIKPKLKWEE